MITGELERCRPWIEAALEYTGGTHSYDDIVEAVLEGRMQLWPGHRAAAITEIISYPKKLALNVFLAGGDLDEIKAALTDVMAWAKTQGCTDITMTGRPGWERALSGLGFRKSMTTMTRGIPT